MLNAVPLIKKSQNKARDCISIGHIPNMNRALSSIPCTTGAGFYFKKKEKEERKEEKKEGKRKKRREEGRERGKKEGRKIGQNI